ncbi:DUF6881 domain-containing protein [Nocardia nova]|uniref:DUF6881 domain-containing protein n=1 Tax=Nocardia nova TaxID=37330 RepID=UPI0011AFD7DC|nr:hypothetical protein [Nocardia nova]
MSTDPSSSNVSVRQQELVHQIVENVRSKMVVNTVPLEWALIDLTWTLIGDDGDLEIGVETADGPFPGWLDQRIGFPPELIQLRDLTHAHEEGTWFTLHLTIPSEGEVTTHFGYIRPQEDSDVEPAALSRNRQPEISEADQQSAVANYQQERIQRIADAVVYVLDANRERLDWTQIELTWTVQDGRALEVEIGITTTDGPLLSWLDLPVGVPHALRDLWHDASVSDRGAWSTLRLVIQAGGEVTTHFGYEPVESARYLYTAADPKPHTYPRETRPKWIQDLLPENAERYRPLDWGPFASGWSSAAEDFTPDEPGMRYFKVTNPGAAGDEGYEIFREVDDEGFECRKVQKFRDGRTECVGGFVQTDRTWLDDDHVDLATLSANPNVSAAEITASQFQTEWLAGGGW